MEAPSLLRRVDDANAATAATAAEGAGAAAAGASSNDGPMMSGASEGGDYPEGTDAVPIDGEDLTEMALADAGINGGGGRGEILNAGTGGSRRTDPTGDQAVMGAGDGVDALEATDENGELVRQEFLSFLQNYQQEVQQEVEESQNETDDEPMQTTTVILQPYVDQAKSLAEHLTDPNAQVNASSSNTIMSYASTMFVNFQHLFAHDDELADAIRSEYYRFEPFLRKAVQSFIYDLYPTLQNFSDSLGSNHSSSNKIASIQVAMYHLPTLPKSIRQLHMEHVGSLTNVTATVTRTSDVRPELISASFRCNKCGLLASNITQQFHFTRPTLCRNPRCKNMSPMQFTLQVPDSEFLDWQKIRVQEHSHQIPPGSMPRSMDVILRNDMVERCKAGDQCVFTGTWVVLPDASALARAGEAPGLKGQSSRSNGSNGRIRPSDAATGGGGGVSGLQATGVRELTYRTCFVACSVLPSSTLQQHNNNEQVLAQTLFGAGGASGSSSSQRQTDQNRVLMQPQAHVDDPTTEQVVMELTPAQRDEIRHMQTSPRLYEQMVDSICPNTFGHREVKKGILLMLLGGIHKTTVRDKIRLRGDINVCVIGDPSTAKSQFLKYVHAFWPHRAVYTSGKASSAAGLTAAVQRDQDTGEYCIEAGALMLADNGICCIDEFDKMDPTDQVAIHEAMEQQTITITKAGIQATLNARASILAAANPIYGRYDRTKTLKANVALSAPILSRFDLFFVVLDDCNPESDRQVANHILQIHRCNEQATAVKPPFTIDQMRRYIRFVRTLNPKLTVEAQRVLVDCYRKLRQGDTLGRSRSAYRITVRQLESMIRLSEALARLHCSDEIHPSYVREAYRLLRTSIIQVETSDVEVEDDEEDEQGNSMDDAANEGTSSGHEDPDANNDTNMDEGEQPLETQPIVNPGEYSRENAAKSTEAKADSMDIDSTIKIEEPKKKKKKKTKISFEEYEAITNAIAGHLRALEGEEVTNYLTWDQALEWYLNQCLDDIGDSLERLEELKKKTNLVIRRLIDVDRILVTVGEAPTRKKDQGKTLLAVHPNYEIS